MCGDLIYEYKKKRKQKFNHYFINFCFRCFRFELTVSQDKLVSMEDLLTVLVLRSKKGVRVNITPRNHNHILQSVSDTTEICN